MSARHLILKKLASSLAAALALLASCHAHAHDPFEITTVAVVQAQALQLHVTMTRSAASRLLAAQTNPAAKEPNGPAPSQAALDSLGATLFDVASDGRPLPLISEGVVRSALELEFRLEFSLPQRGLLRLEAKHLHALPEGYLNAVTLNVAAPRSTVAQKFLHSGDPVFEATVALPSATESWAPEPAMTRFLRFIQLGLHHVLSGYDHLLFLAGVLLPCRRLRTLLGLITCFTVAHSLTLVASALGGMSAPPRLVEPLIAASILYVGLENLLVRGEPRLRYAVTFMFGLVHGLGFAAALESTGLRGASVLPLFSFNLGVELGQLGVAAIFVPLLSWSRRHSYGAIAAQLASVAVALGGAYWLIERIFWA